MNYSDLEQKILDIISDYHNKSNGSCGISAIQIAKKLNMKYANIRDSLNSLHQKKAFLPRQGINGILLFKQKKTSN